MADQEFSEIPEEANAEEAPKEAAAPSTALPTELASLSSEEWANKYARLLAEFDNYRKRMREDMERQAQQRKLAFIVDLLAVVDNFERAVDAAPAEEHPFVQGMRAIDKQLRGLLAAHGVEPVESLGKPFDPHYHEAIAVMDDADAEPNTVSAVFQTGWIRGNDVVRHARVAVTRKPQRETTE